MLVDTIIEEPRWKALDLPMLAEQAACATLDHLELQPGDFEIALLACDDARIAILNAEFREKPKSTNVLSWPAEDLSAEGAGERPLAPELDELGDIAIAYETCLKEAEEQGKSVADHVTHLMVHATLHLLGYDHIRDPDATLMERTEVEILGKLGISDPYS